MTVFETLFFSRLAIGHATARPTDATKPSTRSRVPSFENVRRTDNQVKNRFNSTLRRVLAAGARVGSAPSAPSAKRRRLSERDSPSSPGKSANSCETRAVAESGSENNAVVGLEQLVAASLQVERRESDGEAEDDTSTKSTNTKAHAAAGAADGEGSVRGARAFADHASLLAGMQLQQQLAQLASMAYPAFHGVSVNSMPATFPTAKVVPVTPAPAPEPSAASAMDARARRRELLRGGAAGAVGRLARRVAGQEHVGPDAGDAVRQPAGAVARGPRHGGARHPRRAEHGGRAEMTTERLCFFFRIFFSRARGSTSTREPNAKASERAVAKLPAVPRLYHHLSPRVARRRARSILYQQFSFNTTGWIRFQKSRLALAGRRARAERRRNHGISYPHHGISCPRR
jgi:hypothetical protein